MSKYYVLDFVLDNMPSLIESILMITCLLQLYLRQERMSRATLSRTIWKNRITNWVAISGYKRKLDFWIELSRNSLSNESKLGTNEILRISGRIVGLQSNLQNWSSEFRAKWHVYYHTERHGHVRQIRQLQSSIEWTRQQKIIDEISQYAVQKEETQSEQFPKSNWLRLRRTYNLTFIIIVRRQIRLIIAYCINQIPRLQSRLPSTIIVSGPTDY